MAGRTLVQVNTTVLEIISIFDVSDLPVTGLVNGDFDTFLYKDGVEQGPTSVPITVTEIGDGQYKVQFTPDSVGVWHWRVANETYGPRGWQATFQVTTDGVLTASTIRTDMDASSTKLANLDATVSSRATNAGVRAEMDANSTKLDATVSSRATNAGVRAEMDANSTKLANLDATVSSRAVEGDAMTLTAQEREDTGNAILDIASAIDGLTLRQVFKLFAAVLLGKVTGGPSSPVFKSVDGVTTRVTMIADEDGNRTSTNYNP